MIRLIAVCLIVLLVVGGYFASGDYRTGAGARDVGNVSNSVVANPDTGRGPTTQNKPDEQRQGQAAGEQAADSISEGPVNVPVLLNGDLESSDLLSGDYVHYDRRVLEELVIAGDVTAMQVLALKLAVEGGRDGMEDAENLMQGAAIHGARRRPFEFLARRASEPLLQAARGQVELTETQAREALIETFAYGRLAAMRGYPQLTDAITRLVSREYGMAREAGDLDAIESRAAALYRELQSRRNQLGLGPFGDASPDG